MKKGMISDRFSFFHSIHCSINSFRENTMNYHCNRYCVLLLILITCASGHVGVPAESGTASMPGDAQAKPAVRIMVAYYSRTGNTEKMARGVIEGAERVSEVVATLKNVSDVSKEDLESSDGIILGCPTYFANIPGEMKTIIDNWNWKLNVDFTDKIGGAFSTAGGQMGGQGHVVVSLLLFMLNNRMIVAGPLYRNEATGSIWGESGAAAITGPLDPGVAEEELDGARRLGERVALLTKKLRWSNAGL